VATERKAVEQVLRGLEGRLRVAFEEGTQSQWLHDVVTPFCEKVVVCHPGKRASGENHADGLDAHKLAEGLRLNALKPVFHENSKVQTLKELVRIYESLVGDRTRAKLRVKAVFRARAIRTTKSIYKEDSKSLKQLQNRGAAYRAELLRRQIAHLDALIEKAELAMKAEVRRHATYKILDALPFFGPVRSAQLLATMVTPWRFRTKRQLWKLSGLAVVSFTTAEYELVDGNLVRRRRKPMTRGLNRNHNRTLKSVFMAAANDAATRKGPLKDFYEAMLERGIDPEMAKLTLARKIAAYTLKIWKKGEPFDEKKLTTPTTITAQP